MRIIPFNAGLAKAMQAAGYDIGVLPVKIDRRTAHFTKKGPGRKHKSGPGKQHLPWHPFGVDKHGKPISELPEKYMHSQGRYMRGLRSILEDRA